MLAMQYVFPGHRPVNGQDIGQVGMDKGVPREGGIKKRERKATSLSSPLLPPPSPPPNTYPYPFLSIGKPVFQAILNKLRVAKNLVLGTL